MVPRCARLPHLSHPAGSADGIRPAVPRALFDANVQQRPAEARVTSGECAMSYAGIRVKMGRRARLRAILPRLTYYAICITPPSVSTADLFLYSALDATSSHIFCGCNFHFYELALTGFKSQSAAAALLRCSLPSR